MAASFRKVSLKIYDILGREVETLVDQNQDAVNMKLIGKQQIYGSGVYFYNISREVIIQLRKCS